MASAEPVVRGRFQLSSFRQSWKHCSQASNYLARLIVDQLPEAYYLYSAVINEILEIAFRDAGCKGDLDVSITLGDDIVTMEVSLPSGASMVNTWGAFEAAGSTREMRRASYLRCLEVDDVPHPALGLLQISADYDVRLSFERTVPRDRLIAVMGRLGS